jgi:Phage holin family 2
MPPPNDFDLRLFAIAALMGAVIGLGQLLNSETPLTWRYMIGRALVSAGIACAAPAVLLFFPAMPPTAEFALAALFASLGTSIVQNIFIRLFGKTP